MRTSVLATVRAFSSQRRRAAGYRAGCPWAGSSRARTAPKWGHTAYVVTANTSFAFTIYGMKWDLRPLGILPRGVLVEVYYL